ncbi:ATP-dependent DNA helicase DinG [subsurface metagenome]
MLTPIDLVTDRFKKFVSRFKEFRPYQLETALKVKAAFDRGKKFVLVQAPTGVGKTLLAVMVAATLELQVRYTSHSKQLQAQFVDDFPDAVELLGRNNYLCLKNPQEFPRLSAELCTANSPHCKNCELSKQGCEPNGEGKCSCVSDCPYLVRKRLAINADIAVLNAAYLLRVVNYGGGFSPISLLVLDEVDLTENALLGMIEITFTDRFMEKFGLLPPKYKTKPESWRERAPEWLKVVEQRINQLENAWGIDDLVSLHQLEQKKRQLEFFINEVDDRWVFDGTTFKPIWVSRYADKYLWSHADKILGMSATITPWRQLCRDLSIDPSQAEFIDAPSVFPAEKRLIYYQPAANMNHNSKGAEFPNLVAALDKILERHPHQKGLCHCVSFSNGDQIKKLSKYPERLITHREADRKSQLHRFMESSSPLVLLSPSMERGVDLPNDFCRFVIIAKVPFPYLGDPQVSARLHRGKSAGQAWFDATTARRIVQATGRGMRSSDDFCVSYILDSAFGDFYQRNLAAFPRWWREALIIEKGGDAIEA